jgi:hypothetical protein
LKEFFGTYLGYRIQIGNAADLICGRTYAVLHFRKNFFFIRGKNGNLSGQPGGKSKRTNRGGINYRCWDGGLSTILGRTVIFLYAP